MKLLNHFINPVIEHLYTIDHPTMGVLTYREWINLNTGTRVNFELRGKDGNVIIDGVAVDVEALIEDIHDLIDTCRL